MGTGWSQDEASQCQLGEKPSYNESQHNVQKTTPPRLSETESSTVGKAAEVKAKAEEKGLDAKLCETKAKATGEIKFPYNYDHILRDADSPIDRTSMQKLYDQLCSGIFLNQKRKASTISISSISFMNNTSVSHCKENQIKEAPFL